MTSKGRDMPTHISQYFTADNDRLDVFYAAFKKAFTHMDYNGARHYFALFQQGLKAHIAWEEEVLFPLISQSVDQNIKAKRNTLRSEHKAIINLLAEINNTTCEHEHCLNLCNTFEQLLENHNQVEETIIYPECDNLTNLEALSDTFAKISQLQA